jgi:hypothetical protein
MYLTDLNRSQRELCRLLFACGTIEEVKYLLDYVLSEEDRMMALTLIEIIHMDSAEENGDLDAVKPLVNRMLKRVMSK